ncbi:GNS1/SUR4 family protein [Moelleriella libera RCEF 2490]|uniref:Elongation of fatty acids protein n=1 Tax=Moelleriella libera RCEF 2490 TaxID=1081109 RepID=A0A166UXJ5_9HYPO|nr:GNS1/SUR4 family protein [Moelleriella libera RCEF 2490]
MGAFRGHLALAVPDARLFSFPPALEPAPVSPAPQPFSLSRPFNIPDSLYQAALDPKVPLTIAAVYAVTVKALNKLNASRNKQPWAVSKTRLFFAFVVLHNVFLAVYSAWTFWGMVSGMRRTIVSPFGPGGVAATADSLCHMHGPPGLGNSLYFNDTSGSWESANPVTMLRGLDGGRPSSLQTGRTWTEGLDYFGWIFYLSKFYEVLDTFIILAKGKSSSTLQTYHHAGAMLCMWAGMRFMSAPIWVFVTVNSFIHALMYTYYTLTAFSIRVPMIVKRTLTTMQITQFIGGALLAMAHSSVIFVAPVTVVREVARNLPVPRADSAGPAVATGALGSLKKLIFGSASAGTVATARVQAPSLITETQHVALPCITTANETFAIWLNVLYLAPLTYLFVSFFIASYVKRSTANSKATGKPHRRMSNVALAEKAGWDAARGLEKEVYGSEKMTNGQVNGHARVEVNGDAKSHVSRPVTGQVNGQVNGYANGHANGHANGYANGDAHGRTEVVEPVSGASPKRANGRAKRRA